MSNRTLTVLTLVLLTICAGASTAQGQSTLYVDDDASPGGDGAKWNTAYRYLQDALLAASAAGSTVDAIHVAGGVYMPDQDEGESVTPGDREATFQLISGVAIRGGYRGRPGGNCAGGHPEHRDISLYETILSGDLLGNDVDVESPDDLLDEPTRAENSYHVVTGSGTDTTAVLDGVTVIGGNADGPDPFDKGGGMYNDSGSPTVKDCTFSGTSAGSDGGGIYNHESSPAITDCTFSENSAGTNGGGIYNDNETTPAITNCDFLRNLAHAGAGMYNDFRSIPKLTNSVFSRNTASINGGAIYNYQSHVLVTRCTFSRNSAYYNGGAMHNSFFSRPVVAQCTFEENSVGRSGGAMFNTGSYPELTDCTFSRNSVPRSDGGAIYNQNESKPTYTNCEFSGNSAYRGGAIFNSYVIHSPVSSCSFAGNSAYFGGGMFNRYSKPVLTNCTFSGNLGHRDGGGMYNFGESNPTLTNCILWGDVPNGVSNDGSAMETVTYSNVQGGTGQAWFGEGCIDLDPMFVSPGWWDDNGTPEDLSDDSWVHWDFRLQPASPCIDTGDNTTVTDPFDLDGNSRVVDADADGLATVDMGAYEAPDCNNNGLHDAADIDTGISADNNSNGVPDECELVVTLDIQPGACPNLLNHRSNGILRVAIVGTESFDVTQIDPRSLTLRRADGVGRAAAPLNGPPGPGVKIDDVATQFAGELCDCHASRGDGLDDLLLKFATGQIAQAFELDSLLNTGPLTLTLTGATVDGAIFETSDCLVIRGKARPSPPSHARKRSRP